MKTLLTNDHIKGQNIKVGNDVWTASETPDGCIIWSKSRVNFFGRRVGSSKTVAFATPHWSNDNTVDIEIHPDYNSMGDESTFHGSFNLKGDNVQDDRKTYIDFITNVLSILK